MGSIQTLLLINKYYLQVESSYDPDSNASTYLSHHAMYEQIMQQCTGTAFCRLNIQDRISSLEGEAERNRFLLGHIVQQIADLPQTLRHARRSRPRPSTQSTGTNTAESLSPVVLNPGPDAIIRVGRGRGRLPPVHDVHPIGRGRGYRILPPAPNNLPLRSQGRGRGTNI